MVPMVGRHTILTGKFSGNFLSKFSGKLLGEILLLASLLLAGAPTRAAANPPGGAYIQCDPRNPSSPVRCSPDGW